jgi:hypothetical protein
MRSTPGLVVVFGLRLVYVIFPVFHFQKKRKQGKEKTYGGRAAALHF